MAHCLCLAKPRIAVRNSRDPLAATSFPSLSRVQVIKNWMSEPESASNARANPMHHFLISELIIIIRSLNKLFKLI